MPFKHHRRKNSSNWYIRGTVRGILVDESTRTTDRDAAEEIRIKREAAVLQRSIHGARAGDVPRGRGCLYEAGGERRYLRPLVDYLGTTQLGQIDQAAIDAAALVLKPNASAATRNRQIHTPISAILKHAAKRKMCEFVRVDRPKQPRPRVRWLRPPEAETLIDA